MQYAALDRRLAVAPMMDWTDRHFRYLLRLISRRTLLYTEMIHARAVLQGDRDRLLGFSAEEHPVALQLGGSDPADLAAAAAIGAQAGYDEINLNCGCPSDRVQAGRFGACLMQEPQTVAHCVEAMAERASVPVTVKCRIGVDDQDSEAFLEEFIGTLYEAGCRGFAVHARKAWLKGLSPRENRNRPPLDYDRVKAVAGRFPDAAFLLNGGIRDLDTAAEWLDHFDGVMIGRAACENPWMLADADRCVFGEDRRPEDRAAVARAYAEYAQARFREGVPTRLLVRNLHGLFQGLPGARRWRRTLSEGMPDREGRGPAALIESALESMAAVRPAA